ncbi:hypothetical protein F0562_021768 [Nyssa sinensis]|uniref:Histone H2B n=1 Tax=Nyssa sinensis TaxID=561372 RepID=A0A5J5BLQ3_9ASTE|nr:hypothetical protein F0562_021768 [Nyssa sinensis]
MAPAKKKPKAWKKLSKEGGAAATGDKKKKKVKKSVKTYKIYIFKHRLQFRSCCRSSRLRLLLIFPLSLKIRGLQI